MMRIPDSFQEPGARKKICIRLAEGVLLCLVALYVYAGKDLVPFLGDESTFIRMSKDYQYLFKDRDLSMLLYSPGHASREQRIRVTTGSLNSFLIGAARDLAGLGSTPVNGFWLWDTSPDRDEAMWQENIRLGRLPDSRSLSVARMPSALFGAAAVIVFFLAALALSESRWTAWTATLLLASSPLYLVHVRRALQEGTKMFFLCLALYFAARIVKALKAGMLSRKEYILAGVASGLTLAAKQDVAMALAGIYVGLALIPLQDKDKRRLLLPNFMALLGSGLLAFAVFFTLVPVWWAWWADILLLVCLALLFLTHAPPEGRRFIQRVQWIPIAGLIVLTLLIPGVWTSLIEPVQIMIHARKVVLADQIYYRASNNLPYLNSTESKAGFLAATLFTSSVMDNSPRFNVAARQEQMRIYRASLLSGRHDLAVVDVIVAVLFLLGMWGLIRPVAPESCVALSLFFVSALVLFLATPVAFDRYFMVLQLPYTLIAGFGAQYLRSRLPVSL